MVNKLDLIGHDPRKMEVIAITDKVEKSRRAARAPKIRMPVKVSSALEARTGTMPLAK
ncbi:hypothetical protein ACJJU9_18815 [Pseudomonas helleri]|uniref:hypothetical protein n=1 Tax=Pseudomonas helleri TaxID=1608996 RepID=UPI00389B114D